MPCSYAIGPWYLARMSRYDPGAAVHVKGTVSKIQCVAIPMRIHELQSE